MAVVSIKGFNNNLVFNFGDGSCSDYIDFLKNKFEINIQLFKGSQVVFKGEGLKRLAYDEVAALQRLCLDYGMILNNTEPPRVREKPTSNANQDVIIRRTLRSGQKVRSEGSVAIWGDVHESAEILAAGDIIVLGKLGGVAHAGIYGDLTSVVFALNLAPSQIRIGDKVSRSSDDGVVNNYPEIAYLEGDNICIKEYKSSFSR